MIWQDIVIAIGCFGLAASTIPAIRSKAKPPKLTCLLFAMILISFAVAFLTLGLWLSMTGAFAQAIAWFILLFQRR